jgi:hypothetical protein
VSLSWLPNRYGVYAINTADGSVFVKSIYATDNYDAVDGSSRTPAPVRDPPQPARHIPKWLPPPVGASFGFGNTLVTFSSEGIGFNELVYPTIDQSEVSDFA